MRFPFFSIPSAKRSEPVVPTKKSAQKHKSLDGATRIERLESRIALSVTVKVANNDIFISGDGANNGVAVFEDAIRRLFIYGDIATAIAGDGTVAGPIADTNAGGGREFDPGQYTNIYINMGSGNDLVQVAGLQATDVGILSINTGDASGGDNVSIGQSTFAGSPDIFFGFNATTKSVSITGGNGNDVISVNALTTPNLTVNAGALPDVINLATSDNVVINGNALLDSGGGGGTINIGQNGHTAVLDGSLAVHGGAGNDFFTLDGITASGLDVQTGAGNDQVTLGSNSAVTIHGNANLGGDAPGTTGKIFTVGANAQVTVDGSFNIVCYGPTTLGDSVVLDFLKVGNVLGSLSISAPSGKTTITLASQHDVSVLHGNASIDVGDGGPNTISIGGAHNVSVSGALSVHSGSGADAVSLDSLTASGLNVNTGAGSDSINVAQNGPVIIKGDTFLEGGTGGKTILVGSTNHTVSIDGNLDIATGDDNDSVTLNFLTVGAMKGSLDISSGSGNDTIKLATTGDVTVQQGSASIDTGDAATLDSVTIGTATHNVSVSADLDILTGSGNDAVNVDSLTLGNSSGSLSIHTGAGNDTVTLAANGNISVPGGSVFIDTGDGANDGVSIGSAHTVTISKDLFIHTGTGSDSVSLDSLVATDVNVNTGTGTDSISVAQNHGVTVHGDVYLQGDAGQKTILVGSVTGPVAIDGNLNITTGSGSDSTTLNFLTVGSVKGNLTINTGSGDDTVKLATAGDVTVPHGSASINTGDASTIDSVTIGSATHSVSLSGDLDLLTGGGDDAVVLDLLTVGTIAGSLTINTGGGSDTVTVAGNADVNVPTGSVFIDTGDGINDAVLIGAGHTVTIAEDLFIHTGTGSDIVSLDALVATDVNVNTGAGSDSINVAQNLGVTIHGDVSLQGGAGQKTILIGSASGAVAIDGNLNVTTGSGNDSVTVDFLTVGAVKGTLAINTGLGDDTVKLATAGDVAVPHGSASIDTGDASTSDSVTVGTTHSVTISGDLSIHTGSGNDAVILDSLTVGSIFGSLAISTGVGDDTITIAGNGDVSVSNGSVFIDTGDGVSDTVLVGAGHTVTIAQDLSIHTGDGNDTVTVDQVTTRNLDIHTNGGSDTVTVAGVHSVLVFGSATIDTGDATGASDTVHIGGGAAVSFNSSLAVTLGNGDDAFSLDNLTSTGTVLVNGGAGNNTISIGSAAAVFVTNLLAVQTGAGNDTVTAGTITAGSLAINTGLGVDSASVQHLTVPGVASILAADHNHTFTISGQAFSDVSITDSASHATIALGAGIHKTKEIGPDLKDFPIKSLAGAVGITFAPHAALSRDATLRLTDNSILHSQVTFRLEGYSPVAIDLTPTIKKIALPKTAIVAGSTKKITVPIAITNGGNTAVPKGSKVDVQIYVHNTGTNDDTLITTLSNVSVSALAAGKSKTVKHAIAMPDSLAAGTYEVLVKIVDDAPFQETSILNNTFTSSQTFSVT